MQELEYRTGVIKPVECVKEAWELIKSDFWLLLAVWLVGGIIGSITMLILAGAMTCGTFYTYLRKIDGHEVRFDDLWKGMKWLLPGLVVMLIIVLPFFVVYGIIFIPFILAGGMGGRLGEEELIGLMVGAFAVELVLVVVMVCVHTLIMFAFPLIVDRNLGPIKAMTTSARAVFANLSGVVGLILVNFVLVLAGYLALCIGIYFVIPIIIAGNVVAYRHVFPRTDARLHEPPPISAYGGG